MSLLVVPEGKALNGVLLSLLIERDIGETLFLLRATEIFVPNPKSMTPFLLVIFRKITVYPFWV